MAIDPQGTSFQREFSAVTDSELPRHLSASDSVAWRIEQNPILCSTITLIMRLDKAPDRATLRQRIEATSIAFPRLRQRVVEIPLRVSTPIWANDANFDLDYHLQWINAGPDQSYRAVLDHAAAIAMRAFDRARPLWEWTIVEGLEDGGAAMIIKIHHSVTDGVGGIQLMSQLFDLEREAPAREIPDDGLPGEQIDNASLVIESAKHLASRGIGQARGMLGALTEIVRDPVAGGQELMRNAASTARLLAPANAPLSTVMLGRSPRNRFESFSVSLADLKAAAKRAEGKLNDAYLTALAVGLHKYHQHHGQSPVALRVNMPINLRTDNSGVGGNAWAPARFVLPLVADDVDAHMRDVHDIVVTQRAEPALRYANSIAAILDQLPTALLTETFTGMLTCLDFAATNVPGVPIPLYFAGAEVEQMDTFAPPAGAAVNFALLTYQDMASVGINIDPAAIPDPEVLVSCIQDGFDAVITGTLPERHAVGRRTKRARKTPAATN